MDEVKPILHAILEAQAINAAQIEEIKKAQQASFREMKELRDRQEQIVEKLKSACRVKERPRGIYLVGG